MTLEQFIGEDYKEGPHKSDNYLETAKQMAYSIIIEDLIEDGINDAKTSAEVIVGDMSEEELLETLNGFENN